jgi:LuxR family maltose regulon positive regulatory protein
MGSSIGARLMRARINDRLTHATGFPIALLVAPAGFGKSVALRDFIETSRLDAVRYDVPREDATLLAFVRGLSDALQSVAPSLLAAFPTMQERVLAASEPLHQLSDWFAEHLKRTVCTIVIDDFHHAAGDPNTIALLTALIDRTHERISWIIATRSDAGLPTATWLGYGRMDVPIGEDELRFTPEEALAAAQEAPTPIEADEIEALRAMTEGWPIALAIALRTRTHAADLRSASAGTREMVYRYLAEQSFAGLSDEQRAFLLRTCVFSSFDAGLAGALGASAQFIDELRRSVTFLAVGPQARYRYHDLFRDFLERELRRMGERAWNAALVEGGGLLEARGDLVDALGLYTRAADAVAILSLFDEHGVRLFERGEAAVLAEALEAVPDEVRGENASALGLRAMLEASRGRFDRAELSFGGAIERAGKPELRIALVHRYAIELVRHGRDCVALLEPYARDATIVPRLRAPLLGTLATAYVSADRGDDAVVTIRRAIDLLEPSADNDVRARLLQQAAYVFQFTASRDQARDYAEHAVELALGRNLYDVAARAYSILYTLTNDERDDPIASLAILDKLDECARKAASQQARLFGMIAAYEIEVERGDESAIERIEPLLEEHGAALARARAEALLPALALRASWGGEFRRAYDLLAGTAEEQSSGERRALRFSEIALYAAAAGLGDEAEAALRAAQTALEAPPPSRRTIRSHVFLALAELVRGHATAAHRHLSEAERTLAPPMRRLRALTGAARALYRVQLEQSDQAALSGALERLRAEHFGGLSRLIAALPLASGTDEGYAQLTPAEREILGLLVGGASTKDVAAKTTRSPQTVDTHIRSMCRKLRCSGRREAVALAIRSGWV